MGYFLNNEDPYVLYQEAAAQPYFVDKTEILRDIFPLIDSTEKYICMIRPRRFGKTIMANLIGSFFCKAYKSTDIFDSLKISKDSAYGSFVNQYNVVYIDFSDIDDECKSYQTYIKNIKSLLREDLRTAYPDIKFRENDLRFKGTLGKKSGYTGRILAVGISYDRVSKKHKCLIEIL